MTQLWITLLAVAGFDLVTDLIVTYLRKRARRPIVTQVPTATESESGGDTDETITTDCD